MWRAEAGARKKRDGTVKDMLKTITPWVAFAGCVLVVFVLYWAQAVLVPVALAILLSFVLTPPVNWLRKWCGHVPAVLIVVLLVFAGVLLAGYSLAREMTNIANDLPGYRANIRQKIADVRGAEKGGSVEKIQRTIDDIRSELAKSDTTRGTIGQPVVIVPEQVAGWWGFPSWISPLVGPLGTAGLVIVLTIFMLIERQDLRARLIRLFGHGHLAITTRAFDEAASRVSRQLLMQSLVNLVYGIGAGIGLWLIGVPYALLWAALAAVLRFIPYVGPFLGAGAPIVLSLAALPGWLRPLMVAGLFVGLEMFTNLVLETILYAGAAGVSQVALLIAVAFWTWLWGPFGLLMATPLTVCLVVLGKHVNGLEMLATLMADEPALAPDQAYYQRLLARDQGEAWDLVERHLSGNTPDTVYDALLLPALNYAERDRYDDRLTTDTEDAVVAATRELLTDTTAALRATRAAHAVEVSEVQQAARQLTSTSVLGYAANDGADDLALRMLEQLVESLPMTLEISPVRMLSSEVVAYVRDHAIPIVCIADLPPSPPSKTRYLVRKLRAALPDVAILVGRWAPPELSDDDPQALLDAGATHVSSTLIEAAAELQRLMPHVASHRTSSADTDAA
jgi:predicted PurR-regulated permease PerM